MYAGGGYTRMSKALRLGPRAIRPLLERFPDLVNETSTGGATPLHMCGKFFSINFDSKFIYVQTIKGQKPNLRHRERPVGQSGSNIRALEIRD